MKGQIGAFGDSDFYGATLTFLEGGMKQNEQIVGIGKEAIRGYLDLIHPTQFEAQQRLQGNERTGRTTEMLVQALAELTKGRRVALLFSTRDDGYVALGRIDGWISILFTKAKRRVHNLARAITDPDQADKNDTIFTDHSFRGAKHDSQTS